jgi:membrane protein required for colicin V production
MAELSLTPIDFVVIAVILVSAVFAMLRGLVHETLAILAWAGGAYVALRFTPVIQPLLHGAITPPWVEQLAVLAGTFLLVFIPLAIISRRLSAKVKSSAVGALDRLLGLIFGVVRGVVIVGLAYIVFGALVPLKNYPAALTQARLFPLIRETSDLLRSLVPAEERPLPPKTTSASAAGKAYGAGAPSALDRLFQTNGGGDSTWR